MAGWCAWAGSHDVHDKVIDYVRATPDIFGDTCSNPRAWTAVSDHLKALEASDFDPKHDGDLLLALCAGDVGATLARAFVAFYRAGGQPLPTTPELLRNYRAKYQNMVRTLAQQGRTPELTTLSNQLAGYLSQGNRKQLLTNQRTLLENLAVLLRDLPGDLRQRIRADIPWLSEVL